MKWEIRYFASPAAQRSKAVAFKETITGDKNYVTKWAQCKLKGSKFVAFELSLK